MYGRCTYIYHQNQPNVIGEYTSPMDPMGHEHRGILGASYLRPQFRGFVSIGATVE